MVRSDQLFFPHFNVAIWDLLKECECLGSPKNFEAEFQDRVEEGKTSRVYRLFPKGNSIRKLQIICSGDLVVAGFVLERVKSTLLNVSNDPYMRTVVNKIRLIEPKDHEYTIEIPFEPLICLV